MKVAVIAPTVIPSRKANTMQVMKMSQAFASTGHQVQVIIPDDARSQDKIERSWQSLAAHYGLQVQFPLFWEPTRAGLRKYDYAWTSVRWAANWGSDIIYTRLPQAAALASIQDQAVIFEIHDMPQGRMAPFMLRLFLRGPGAQRLITISDALAADVNREYQNPKVKGFVKVLPDGVDLQRYQDLASPEESRNSLAAELSNLNRNPQAQFFPERFTAGYTGHLYPGRGLSLILELAALIPEINFLIAGGEEQDIRCLVGRALERGLENLTITGFVPNADLPRFQAACDVLLMPYQPRVSASSGGDIGRYLSPMKLFEYMACGRAICASSLPVLQEILCPEFAFILPPDDIKAWETAVRDLKNDPALRKKMADQGKTAARKYSWESRAAQMLDEKYRELQG